MTESMPNDPPPNDPSMPADTYSLEPDPEKPSPLAKALLYVLLLVVVAGGVTMWWTSNRGGPAKAQANAFIEDLVAGRLPAARARCAPDIDVEAMDRLYENGVRFWGKMIHISLVANPRGDRADVDGDLEFQNLKKAFSATLMKQPDGTYLITSYSFN
ncbi:hypothetical protein BH09PLA1_BH09PLA1_01740 [soil metagenome]